MKPAVEVTAAVTGHHLILSATDEGKPTPERYQKLPSAAVTGHHLILSATDEGNVEKYRISNPCQ
jgi:hypothetical protein